ncbi:galactokinase [Aeromicrobium marinum DSM 15272]|uniref:Galactokinase n=1 Tax=Aeromicrobium marinum DSM 15272 TaxID=585531 RepID=E2SFV2_9ACTN|nr:galactokinase [Aeromicrobium marinum]EFQ81899.1 galactokinase [Aeromicrobium marinum DSM 15272]
MDDVRRWTVPGRVNLIGEHLDHNGGPTLPMAIDRAMTLKVRRRPDSVVNVWSDGRRATFDLGVAPGQVDGWAAYPAAAIWAVARAGHAVGGVDLVVESDLPAGAGLASSAALVAGTALAVLDAHGIELPRERVAAIAQSAENDGVGVPVGRMDHLAVLCARQGHALQVDHGSEPPALGHVPVTWADAGLTLVVIDTRSRHSLAESEYAARRAECAQAAEALGLTHLAQAGVDAVLRLDSEVAVQRTRHVITETARVRGAANALRAEAWPQLGAMLTASHASLRDDFEVSCPELDVAVETAVEAGALGARMTGGGFGGSAIALVEVDRVDDLRRRVEARHLDRDWPQPHVFAVRPSPAARLEP